MRDSIAQGMTKFFRFIADRFFAKRYGHRAVVLETIAGVPGMVAGMWIHLKSLRQMKTGYGPVIRELLEEAENERMHLMFFIEIPHPKLYTPYSMNSLALSLLFCSLGVHFLGFPIEIGKDRVGCICQPGYVWETSKSKGDDCER